MRATETDFQAWMGGVQARMEAALSRLLPAAQIAPARLHAALRYATLEGEVLKPLADAAAQAGPDEDHRE